MAGKRLTIDALATQMALIAGNSKDECLTFLYAMFNAVVEGLTDGEVVRIKDFGSFRLVDVDERKSVDVSTGEEIIIPAHKKIVFLENKEFSKRLNKEFEGYETVELEDEVEETSQQSEDSELPVENQIIAESEIPEINNAGAPGLSGVSEASGVSEITKSLELEEGDETSLTDTRFDEQSNEEDLDDEATSEAYLYEIDNEIKEEAEVFDENVSENVNEEEPTENITEEAEAKPLIIIEEPEENSVKGSPLEEDEIKEDEELQNEAYSEKTLSETVIPDYIPGENIIISESSEEDSEIIKSTDEPEPKPEIKEEEESKEPVLEKSGETDKFETSENSEQPDKSDLSGKTDKTDNPTNSEKSGKNNQVKIIKKAVRPYQDRGEYYTYPVGGAPEFPATSKNSFAMGAFWGALCTFIVCGIVFLIGFYFGWYGDAWSKKYVNDSEEQNYTTDEILTTPLEDETEVYDYDSLPTEEQPSVETLTGDQNKEIVYDTVTNSRYLTYIARDHYGNYHFWPYIYEENKEILGNPNRVKPGTRVVVPDLSKYDVDPTNKDDIEKAKKLEAQILSKYY